jgi:hypothetical protein
MGLMKMWDSSDFTVIPAQSGIQRFLKHSRFPLAR